MHAIKQTMEALFPGIEMPVDDGTADNHVMPCPGCGSQRSARVNYRMGKYGAFHCFNKECKLYPGGNPVSLIMQALGKSTDDAYKWMRRKVKAKERGIYLPSDVPGRRGHVYRFSDYVRTDG